MAIPLFITFEGGEGVGKSTQVQRLVARLVAAGHEAVATREPGGSPKAEILRALLLSGAAAPLGTAAEAILFSAARIDHVARTIRPALDRGAWVICDRFTDSTQAYQGVLGHVSPAMLTALRRVAVGTCVPDLTFVLDLPAHLGLARARARQGGAPDRFEREEATFHGRLQQAFRDIAAAEPDRCVLVDASADVEGVAAAVWHVVEKRLGAAGTPSAA